MLELEGNIFKIYFEFRPLNVEFSYILFETGPSSEIGNFSPQSNVIYVGSFQKFFFKGSLHTGQ